MDYNATFEYTLSNFIGLPALMVKVGQPKAIMKISDDGSYNYASSVIEEMESQTIKLEKIMRESSNQVCKNGSYPLRGGNENCSIYIAV